MARRGLADSREIAQRLIMAGRVRVNSRPAYKADLKVDSETPIALMAGAPQFASRGAYKLIAALEHFGVSVEGKLAMDVGASTGGFTDVLLRRGAGAVIAMDVGYGQLDFQTWIPLARSVGMRHFFVERDYSPDALKSAGRSYEPLRKLLSG